ncbi:MAG: DsbC family protein [bacterium]|nr:MAG: DsbC family protein [bacterium]
MATRRPPLTYLAALFLAALLFFPHEAAAFGEGGCGEGQCSDCHSITAAEAGELLKDMVRSVDNVGFAQVPGLFAATVTGNDGRVGLVYIDFSKSYVISGVAVRIADRENVSRDEMLQLRRIDISTLPLDNSLVLGRAGAPKKAILFTDPQCPYCKKLHPELAKVVAADPDVVFYIKMLPLVRIHPDAYRISRSILCADSLQLLEDSFAGKQIPDPTCDSDAVDRTLKLAQELGIGSTPTLVLPDGRIAPGYRSAEDILKLINGGK